MYFCVINTFLNNSEIIVCVSPEVNGNLNDPVSVKIPE